MAQQGIPPMVLTKMFGHTDVKLIMKVYYKQHDGERMVDVDGSTEEYFNRFHDAIATACRCPICKYLDEKEEEGNINNG